MQSILLATPSKASKLEIRHDNKLSNEGTNVQGKDGSKKSANGFASVLEKTALDSKGIENKELESKKSESKDSEDKSSEGKELQAKVSKKETLEKT